MVAIHSDKRMKGYRMKDGCVTVGWCSRIQGVLSYRAMGVSRKRNKSGISELRETIEKVMLNGRWRKGKIEEICKTEIDIIYKAEEY